MKHIVSFETAKKLKAAGFERPKPEIGQFKIKCKTAACAVYEPVKKIIFNENMD